MSHLSHLMCLSYSFTHTDWFLLAFREKKKEGGWGRLSFFQFYSTLDFILHSIFSDFLIMSCCQLFFLLPSEKSFRWLNAALDRLWARHVKPQISALHWIWSLLRYRLILPYALITSAIGIYLPTCRDMIASRWVVCTWWEKKNIPWLFLVQWDAFCVMVVHGCESDTQQNVCMSCKCKSIELTFRASGLSDADLSYWWKMQGSGDVFSNSQGYGIAMTTEAGLFFFCCFPRGVQTELQLTIRWNKAHPHHIFQPRLPQHAYMQE